MRGMEMKLNEIGRWWAEKRRKRLAATCDALLTNVYGRHKLKIPRVGLTDLGLNPRKMGSIKIGFYHL